MPTTVIAKSLVEAGASLETANMHGKTALMMACDDGYSPNIDMALILLSAGANPTAKDKHGRTPLSVSRGTAEPDERFIQSLIAYTPPADTN